MCYSDNIKSDTINFIMDIINKVLFDNLNSNMYNKIIINCIKLNFIKYNLIFNYLM